MIDRTHELEICRGLVKATGYGWVYGMHGIGKTTFAHQLIPLMSSDGVDCKYLDLRAEKGIYPDLAACINEHAFGEAPLEKTRDNLRILRDYCKQPGEKQVCLFLDELDVYSTEEVEDVRRFAETMFYAPNRSLSLVFLSARSKSFFEADDPASARHSEYFIRLDAFGKPETQRHLEEMGYQEMAANKIADLSGGNPELLKILTSEFLPEEGFDSGRIYSKALTVNLNHYFRTLWSGLDPSQQGIVIVVAAMLSALALEEVGNFSLSKPDLFLAAIMLNGLHPFGAFFGNNSKFEDPEIKGKLPFDPPVSPLFQSWVVINHGAKLSADSFPPELQKSLSKGSKILGMDVDSWKNLSTSISVATGFQKLAGRLLELL
jgi:hypothetical protein